MSHIHINLLDLPYDAIVRDDGTFLVPSWMAMGFLSAAQALYGTTYELPNGVNHLPDGSLVITISLARIVIDMLSNSVAPSASTNGDNTNLLDELTLELLATSGIYGTMGRFTREEKVRSGRELITTYLQRGTTAVSYMQASWILSCHPDYIRRCVRKGKLVGTGKGQYKRITIDSISDFLGTKISPHQ